MDISSSLLSDVIAARKINPRTNILGMLQA